MTHVTHAKNFGLKMNPFSQVFLMEAMWMYFLPAHKLLMEEIKKGTIGEVIHIEATLGFDLDLPRLLRSIKCY